MRKINNNFLLMAICSILFELIIVVGNKLLYTKELLYNYQLEIYTSEQLKKVIRIQNITENMNVIINFCLLFFKSLIIASIVYTGIYFFSKKKIHFRQIWNIVLKAEFIFLLVPVCKIIWFYFFETNYQLVDIQKFYPLAAINITGYQGLEQCLVYPFQVINLFEIAYVSYMALHIGKITETTQDFGFKVIGYSYVPMLILWIVVVMFINLTTT